MTVSVLMNSTHLYLCVSLLNYVKCCALNYDKTLLTIPILNYFNKSEKCFFKAYTS